MITRRVFSFKRLRFVTSLVDSSFFTKSKEVFLSDLPSSNKFIRRRWERRRFSTDASGTKLADAF